MVYLVYSNQSLMLKKHVEKIIADSIDVVDDFSCVQFDCETTPLHTIINDVETLPLGCDKKVVIARNAFFFTDNTIKKDVNSVDDYQDLLKYLTIRNSPNTLIFTVVATKLSDKKEITKAIKKYGRIAEIADITEKERPIIIRKLLEKKDITLENNEVFNLIVNRLGDDLNDITNEIAKLQLMQCTITKEIALSLIPRQLEDNIFGIIDALIEHNINEALKIFYDLRIQNEDPISLLPRMASQLRLMYQVLYLKKQGYSEGEMAQELAVHPYRVTLVLRKKNQINHRLLLQMICDLAILDYEIKSGLSDKFQAFEMFLIRYA